MANSKLSEVLLTLEFERETIRERIDEFQYELAVIEEAIQGIKKIVFVQSPSEKARSKTNIQVIEEILRASPKPIHILGIVEIMKEKLEKDISRPTIDTAISRHLKSQGETSRILRLGDGMYEYKREKKTCSPEQRGVDLVFQ